MRIGILGPLDVRDDAGRPVEVAGRRLRALLVRLAAEVGRPIPAERLLDDLWDGPPPGGNALQALVSRLRGVVGRDLVEHGPAGYRLGIDPGAVDAVAFERAIAAARTEDDPARRAERFGAALALWLGPALADVADMEFASGTIARLDELRLTAVEDRVDAQFAAGLFVGSDGELRSLAAANPLRERLRGQLMRALYADGRQAEALEVFEETRRALAERLGVDPSPGLSAVHLSILRGDAPAGRTPPAPAPRPVRRANLPAQLTSFVGREEESRRVGKLFRQTRLVTLTGPGGAGKTRLAVESATALIEETPDGVWFVPLAPVGDQRDVVHAVLAALGVPEAVRPTETRAVVPSLERLTDFLAARRLIIILDNCEHLIDTVARLVDHVLAHAEGVRVLATSREPLGITGESLCPVPSLPLPDADVTDPADALGYASVRLFADRAAAVRPGFSVDAATVSDVVAICRALDGIPLAIELAAARLRSLTPGQVAARLGDRFRLFADGSRTALPRHRTLRAVVDWSWDLLDDVERTVLRRLSVFAGGATPDTAVHVCGLDAPDALAAHLVRLAERAEPELRRRDQLAWAERIMAERDNITAAFRHVVETRDVETALRLVASMVWFWAMRDMELDAGEWAVAVRDIAGHTAPPGLEEQYALCGVFSALISEVKKEGGPTSQSLAATIEGVLAVVPETPAHPLLALAGTASAMFGLDTAEVRRQVLRIQDHPDPWVRAIARVVLGHLAINFGDIDEAGREVAEGYARFRDLGDRFGMILGLTGMMRTRPRCAAHASLLLCELALVEDDFDGARSHAERARAWAEARAHHPDSASALRKTYSRLGCLAEESGDLETAEGWHVRAFTSLQKDALVGNPTLAVMVEGLAGA